MWDVPSGEPICGSPAATDTALAIAWSRHDSFRFMSGGHYNLRLWEFDRAGRRLHPTDAIVGKLRRIVTSICIDDTDSFAYCGTQTGDVLKINTRNGRFVVSAKSRYEKGILSVASYHGADGRDMVLLGTGAGLLARLVAPPGGMPLVEDRCA